MKGLYFFIRLGIGILAEISFIVILIGAPLLWVFNVFSGITALKFMALLPLIFFLRRSGLSFVLKKADESEQNKSSRQ